MDFLFGFVGVFHFWISFCFLEGFLKITFIFFSFFGMGLLEFLGFRIFIFFLGWAFLLRFYLGFLSIFGGDFISCGVFLWVFVGLGFFL